jgi:hypothetical protein
VPWPREARGAGAELHPRFLVCYKVKARAPVTTTIVALGNPFGPYDGLSLVRRREFFVPSVPRVPSTTTVGSPSGAFGEAPA